jgi:hypothetical protein
MRPLFLAAFFLTAALTWSSPAIAVQGELSEIDGTITQHDRNYAVILDMRCHEHGLNAPPDLVLDGRLFKNYPRTPINVHAVVQNVNRSEPRLISVTPRATGAPQSCRPFSNIRTMEGILTEISSGNAVGTVEIERDTGSTEVFAFQLDRQNLIRFDGHPFRGCFDWPSGACPNMPWLRRNMRVRISYKIETVDNKHFVDVMAINSLPSN